MSNIKEINGKFYDFSETNNPSFLLTAKELKTVGVKNYYFMLQINNPRVADIDPFKKNITRMEVQALMEEYSSNMWYFIRNAVRMRTTMGVVPFCLHRGLAAAIWCFARHQDSCLVEPRQTYKTTGLIGGPICWAFQLSRNTHMHFFGKETENTKRNLEHLKNNVEVLPEWLQFTKFVDEYGKEKKARRSTEKLINGLMYNDVIIHPKATSLAHAQGMGRGGSGNILYFDEIEFMPFFGEILSNSAPLFKTASENAAAAGLPYARIFTTTPGNLDTKEGLDALPIIESMIPWTEKLYDMTEEEIAEYKSQFKEEYHSDENKKHTREVIDVFYIEYQYYQLRKTYEWVQEQYKLSGDRMAIRREILLQRLRGSTSSPIDPEDIEYLISNMKKSDRDILINSKWRFRLYDHGAGYIFGQPKAFDEDIPYLVGIDPAGGGGGDNFAITIANPYNLKIAAEFKSPYITGPSAVRMLETLVTDYIPNAVLIPEKNSMGIYLIQMLLETSIAKNLYWSDTNKQLEQMSEESEKDYELKALSAKIKKYGTYTSPKVRNAMFELLFQYIAACKDLLCTEYLVNDLCQLIRTSTGRFEAVTGGHDDCLMSWLHILYVYHTGDNLSIFNINPLKFNPLAALVTDEVYTPKKETDDNGFFSTEHVKTYNELMMECMALDEERSKLLVDKFAWVHDPVYSRVKANKKDEDDESVSISPYFFETIN